VNNSGNKVEELMVDGLPFVLMHFRRKDLNASLVLTPREAIEMGSELQRVADEVNRHRESLRKVAP
jgi:hypothetical protein